MRLKDWFSSFANRESTALVPLKPQDVLVLLKLAVHEGEPWSYAALAESLSMSSSEVHAAVRRAAHAGLMRPDRRRPDRAALLELLVHGVKFVFAAERGGLTRGIPTAHAAPPLSRHFPLGDEPPLVWPDPEGAVRGEAFRPLYRSAPQAARVDPKLYQALALVDAVRAGGPRVRRTAEQFLERLLAS